MLAILYSLGMLNEATGRVDHEIEQPKDETAN